MTRAHGQVLRIVALIVLAGCGGTRTNGTDASVVADAASGDAAVIDAHTADDASSDASVGDATLEDAALNDAALNDAAVDDSAVSDASVNDAMSADATSVDATLDDASIFDASVLDATLDDASILDAAVMDATSSDMSVVDAGADAATMADAALADAGAIDADVGSDAGTITGSVRSPAAEIVRAGTTEIILRGTVLTPTGILDPGEVVISANIIACVAADCSSTAGADTATIIDTHGIISPGLIDAHNHLAYDFLGEWVAPVVYGSRYDWSNDPSYEAFIAPYADHRSTGSVYCPAAKWGELRSIVHGTTTVQGESFQQSCVNVLARNADHYDGLGYKQLTTNIASVRDINDSAATTLIGHFTQASDPVLRYVVHMSEGVDAESHLEFASFAGRDPRTNRHMGESLLSGPGYSGVAVLVHSVSLTPAELMEAATANAKVVWSPSSNMILYGATADIATWLDVGITIGMGPDWTVSGEDDMLGELRFARNYGHTLDITNLTSRRLWEMATLGGAEVVGLAPDLGRLQVGSRADILVIGRQGGDPYDAVIDADARDVRLTMIDGVAYYGDLSVETATAVNGVCDAFDACGTPKFLCVKDVPATASTSTTSRTNESLDDVRTTLLTLLNGYGRSDLLPLASECPSAM